MSRPCSAKADHARQIASMTLGLRKIPSVKPSCELSSRRKGSLAPTQVVAFILWARRACRHRGNPGRRRAVIVVFACSAPIYRTAAACMVPCFAYAI
jgi:hypothetical protein